ncbi:MAG TPA: SAM-dependent chlorinase/fluorinase [Methylomirabilota bacterium]|nr:SAM-dependent chlorinase/fluorinase [Methylomirabilota bacterium]
MSAIITLTTDFGTRDAYVAEMKGVMLDIAASADRVLQLVDVTHEVAAHDVTEGALTLDAAAPYFPRGSVHLAVVDPGVGTDRRGLVVRTEHALLVGPDNGLFTPFLEAATPWQAWELRAEQYRLPAVSRTFHGRDIFAPAAAHLAAGVSPHRFGPAVRDPVRLSWPTVRAVAGAVAGAVLHVDRFGNLVTSIRAETLADMGEQVAIRLGGRPLALVGTYGDLAAGQAGALIGSSGRLEIAVREGSAAARFKARRGTPVVVSRSSAPASRRGRREP